MLQCIIKLDTLSVNAISFIPMHLIKDTNSYLINGLQMLYTLCSKFCEKSVIVHDGFR